MLMCPVPGMIQEFVTAQICFFNPLLGQHVDHPGLCGNGGMIGSRHPQGIFSQHAGTADQNILKGIVEHVSHVQHSGYIGWGYYDAVRFPLIGGAFKELILHPVSVPLILHTGRIIFRGNIHFDHFLSPAKIVKKGTAEAFTGSDIPFTDFYQFLVLKT